MDVPDVESGTDSKLVLLKFLLHVRDLDALGFLGWHCGVHFDL